MGLFANIIYMAKEIILKTLLISILLFACYYIFVFRPREKYIKNLSEDRNNLQTHYSYLVQNKIAFENLKKIDVKNTHANFDKEKSIEIVTKTSQEGASRIKNNKYMPKTNKELKGRYTDLLNETLLIYINEDNLMDELKRASDYSKGMELLSSEKYNEILSKQSQLIIEYTELITKLNITSE